MSTHACERCEIDHPWRECEPWPEEPKEQMTIHLSDEEIQNVRDASKDEHILPCPICGKIDHIGLQEVKIYLGGKWNIRKNFYCGRCGIYAQPSDLLIIAYWNRMVERLTRWAEQQIKKDK